MFSARENLLRVYRHEKPERLPVPKDLHTARIPYEKCYDPVAGYDWFGIHWTTKGQPGPTVTEGEPYMQDLENWERRIHFPNFDDYDLAQLGKKFQSGWDREEKLGLIIDETGPFERLLSVLGFENALVSFYDMPDETADFLAAVADYKIELAKQIHTHFHPDVIMFHDDWGGNQNMLFSPDCWREFLKPNIARLVQAVHELGILYEQHSCGHVQPILGDLVEIGVDAVQIQGSSNDLAEVKQAWGDRMVFHGCFDFQKILSPNIAEQDIRKYVRQTLDILAPGGGYVPSNSKMANDMKVGDSISAAAIVEDEIIRNRDRYN